jgi:hypothetical protein
MAAKREPKSLCQLCTCEVSVINKTTRPALSCRDPGDRDEVELCDVCYRTFLGSFFFYSQSGRADRDVLVALCQCTNLILEEIRKVNRGR